MKKIKTALRHNIFLTAAVVVAISVAVFFLGCQPTTRSPINNQEKVTRSQLDAEKGYILAQFTGAYEDLAQQEMFRQKVFEIGLMAAQGGTVDPVGAAVTLLGILGVGAVADNRRKDTVIKTLKNKDKA